MRNMILTGSGIPVALTVDITDRKKTGTLGMFGLGGTGLLFMAFHFWERYSDG